MGTLVGRTFRFPTTPSIQLSVIFKVTTGTSFTDGLGNAYGCIQAVKPGSGNYIGFWQPSSFHAYYSNGAWEADGYRTISFFTDPNEIYLDIDGQSLIEGTVDDAIEWFETVADEITPYLAQKNSITSIANAIRTKGGTSAALEFPDDFVSAINAIPTGGGGGGATDGDVIFIDYDGTIVDAKTKAEINAMTSDSDLPANPSHTGLTAQGWNWTVAQLKAQLIAIPSKKVYVGQMYVTASGATEIDVEMQEGRLSPILTICVNGTVSVDWGDNTTPDSVTGTSETVRLEVPHTYAQDGRYTIKIASVSGTYSFYGSSVYTLLRKNTTGNENRIYSNCIKAIRIGNGITRTYDYAFAYCYSLSSVTIPSGVTSIGPYAFYYCYSLPNVTIPSGITSIGNYLVSYCFSMSSIAIPGGVTSISSSAFYSCYSLSNITIPSGVTSIASSVFTNCYSLSSITIPSDVTSIGSSAFNACLSLNSITIPSGVTSIGTSAFTSCHSLGSITIPSGVTSIENNTFTYCYSLSSITIPSGVTKIGNSAFSNCYSLGSITIPSDVTSIGNSAFANCYGVKEYHIKPTTIPTAGTTIFSNIASDCVIYVPSAKLNDYKSATGWADYASYMQGE